MWSQMPVPKCSGSIRKSVVFCPNSLVPSIVAHERPGPKCPGLTGMSVLLRCFFFSSLEHLRRETLFQFSGYTGFIRLTTNS